MSLITALAELLGDHGVAAVLDDNGLSVPFLNVGQRLHQDGGALHIIVHVHGRVLSFWD